MYPDIVYNLLHVNGLTWVFIGTFFAIFDYGFNVIMCFVTGGIQNLRSHKKKARKIDRRRLFVVGGYMRLKEFQSDFLSWLWPITNLALPITLYGITRWYLLIILDSLSSINIQVPNYQILPNSHFVQFCIWFFCILVSITTIYRYKYRRSKPTWFSKSTIFSVTRVILFNTPITYAIVNIIFLILSFLLTFYRILLDGSIAYNIFHSDQMYGLRASYDAIIRISLILILISFLPTTILIREKEQTYNKIYKLGIYSGIIITFIIMGVLVYQFGQRLETIQKNALLADLLLPLSMKGNNFEILTALMYYNVIASLPNGFQVPAWLSSLFSIRAIVLGYELFKIFISNTKEVSISEILKSLASKL